MKRSKNYFLTISIAEKTGMTKRRYLITAITRDHRGHIISSAVNSYTKTHPIQSHFAKLAGEPEKKYLHAEILSLIRAGDRKPYTLEISSDGISKPYPCAVCQKAIAAWGVRKVIVL